MRRGIRSLLIVLVFATPAFSTDWWMMGIASPNGAATRFISPFVPLSLGTQTAEGSAQLPAPFAVTATDLVCVAATAPGSGKSFAFTLRKAGVDTAMTCTIADTATTCSQTGQAVAIALGDLLALSDVPASAPTASNHRCAISVN